MKNCMRCKYPLKLGQFLFTDIVGNEWHYACWREFEKTSRFPKGFKEKMDFNQCIVAEAERIIAGKL